MNEIKEILENILSKISDDYELEEMEVAGQKVLHINSKNDSKVLIGHRGQTLRSIDYLISKIMQQRGIEDKILIDINKYKLKEIEEIADKARLLANRAKTLQYDVEMPPMSSYERLIVHATLSEDPQVSTESHGEGKDRRLVIKFIG